MLRCVECLCPVGPRGRSLIHVPTHLISTYYEDELHVWLDDIADRCDLYPERYGGSGCVFYTVFESGMSHDQHFQGRKVVFECL